MKTVIHVNQAVIRKNRKTGERQPPLAIKTYKDNRYAHEAILRDADGKEVARLVYSPDKPLKCGAVCYITTDCEVEVC